MATKVKPEENDLNAKKNSGDLVILKDGIYDYVSWSKALITGVPCTDLGLTNFFSITCKATLAELNGFISATVFLVRCTDKGECKSSDAPLFGDS